MTIHQLNPWTPFKEAYFAEEDLAQLSPEARTILEQDTVYLNSRYQVNVREVPAEENHGFPPMIHLSIKRLDKEAIHDWRDLQRIKNEIVGPEHEGLEIYPAESRLVDGANQYHLWVCAEPGRTLPIGFFEGRQVSDVPSPGAKQRPFDS
jgi:hypothetical protein